jgi:hypothetical protein
MRRKEKSAERCNTSSKGGNVTERVCEAQQPETRSKLLPSLGRNEHHGAASRASAAHTNETDLCQSVVCLLSVKDGFC